jgi:hypothetical protein
VVTVAVRTAEGATSFVATGGEFASTRMRGEGDLVRFFDQPF